MHNDQSEKSARRINGAAICILLFGAVNLYDALSRFGYQTIDAGKFGFFMFSLWVALRNTVSHTLLLSAPAFLFGRRARIWLVASFWGIFLVESLTVFADKVFHANFGSVILQILDNTSWREIWNFAIMLASPLYIALLLILVAVLALSARLIYRARYPAVSKKSIAAGLAMVFLFLLLQCWTMNWHFGVLQMRYTLFLQTLFLQNEAMKHIGAICEQPKIPDGVRASVAPDAMPDGVIVLGESSTRNNWHLYGYPRHTTPEMDRLAANGELVAFTDVVGIQPVTLEALALLLTDMRFKEPASGNWPIAELFRRAGYTCKLITNQMPSWGDQKSLLHKIFNGCTVRISLGEEARGKEHFDGLAAEILEKELATNTAPTIVFIHLNGLHYPLRNANPPEYNVFNDTVEAGALEGFSERGRDRLNRYDNAILYEDAVLGAIVDVMKKRERPAFMFFISDHGESPRAWQWRDYENIEVYEVPALFWASKKYRDMFPGVFARCRNAANKPVQSDELTHGLLEFALIEGAHKPEESFLDDSFKPRSPRFINKGRMVYSPRPDAR